MEFSHSIGSVETILCILNFDLFLGQWQAVGYSLMLYSHTAPNQPCIHKGKQPRLYCVTLNVFST